MKKLLCIIALLAGLFAQAQQIDMAALDAAIKALAPIDGISVGSYTDKTTWRVDYQSTATTDQIAAVNSYLAGIDPVLLQAQYQYWLNYAAFNKKTAAIEAAGFTYQGMVFHCDQTGLSNIQSMVLVSTSPVTAYPTYVYDSQNTWTFNNATDIATMAGAVFQFVGQTRMTAKPLRDALAQQPGETSATWLARMQSWTDSR